MADLLFKSESTHTHTNTHTLEIKLSNISFALNSTKKGIGLMQNYQLLMLIQIETALNFLDFAISCSSKIINPGHFSFKFFGGLRFLVNSKSSGRVNLLN
jgi:hypothetical protein